MAGIGRMNPDARASGISGPGSGGLEGQASGPRPSPLALQWRKLPILMALAPSLAGRRRGRPPGASLVDAIDGPWGAALAGTVAG